MPTTITSTITLPDDGSPTLHVQLDTETIANREATPAEVVTVLKALAPNAAAVWEPTETIVARLQAAVDEGKKAQAARTKALKDWQAALTAVAPEAPSS